MDDLLRAAVQVVRDGVDRLVDARHQVVEEGEHDLGLLLLALARRGLVGGDVELQLGLVLADLLEGEQAGRGRADRADLDQVLLHLLELVRHLLAGALQLGCGPVHDVPRRALQALLDIVDGLVDASNEALEWIKLGLGGLDLLALLLRARTGRVRLHLGLVSAARLQLQQAGRLGRIGDGQLLLDGLVHRLRQLVAELLSNVLHLRDGIVHHLPGAGLQCVLRRVNGQVDVADHALEGVEQHLGLALLAQLD
mmetsp:Transcript_38876/g.88415  ORF Transcript_38876/g.88415 Transcript_38876/m.88415 type:complete len:253 (+) Transcript_38876:156-914(+)